MESYYDFKEIEPLFPFGHGLSYTTFEYSNLRLNSTEFGPEDEIHVFLNITNTGKTAGKETVQLYLKDVESTLVRPPKELKAFTKIHLEPGETKTLSLTLSRDSLTYYDPAVNSWVSEAGEFELQLGSSSRDIRQKTKFKWKGDPKPVLEFDSIRHIGLPLKILLDDEPSKQVLTKHLGKFLSHPNFDQAIEMNLEQIAVHLPGFLTKEKLEDINKDLAEIS